MILALLLAAAAPAADAPAPEPTRFNTLMVFGSDPCPRSVGDEIVVCARMPENERYRIPKKLRGKKTMDGPTSVAWGRKVDSLEYAGRVGLPNTCSPVGSGGATGCFQQFLAQNRAEREAARIEQGFQP